VKTMFLLLLLLSLVVVVSTQTACTYRRISGVCRKTSECDGAYEPTISSVGTTGCMAFAADVQCCARPPCQTATRSGGVCRATADCAAAGGTKVQSNEGASGCNAFPPDIQCCFAPSPVVVVTPRPTPRPTPSPKAPTTVQSVRTTTAVPLATTPSPQDQAVTTTSGVATGGCSQVRCAFNEECRPDDRGAAFPGKCAQKQNIDSTTKNGSTNAAPSGALELWLILVIVGAAFVVIMIICCVIAACIIKKKRIASERAAATTAESVGMYELHGGAHNPSAYPSGHPGVSFNTSPGQGAGYTQGSYPATMQYGAQTPEGSAVYNTGGTQEKVAF
jgi:hypothetical protein